MTTERKLHLEITKSMFWRATHLPVMLVIILLFTVGTTGYYFLEAGPKEQQRARIQPLLESGLSLDGSTKFDMSFSDQSFRWPWQKNQAYHGDEIKFAEMWLNDSVVTEVLLNYYYCASSNYYSLVWLFGSLKRGVSFWEDALRLVVHGDANDDEISNYDSLLGNNADLLNTFMPNPVTIYALKKNLTKESVRRLKPFDMDGQMDEWEQKAIDMVLSHDMSEVRLLWIVENLKPNIATIYALQQDLPNAWIEWINPLGRNGRLAEWERYIIDHLAELPSVYVEWAVEKAIERRGLTDWEKYLVNHVDELPDCFIEEVLKDGDVSYEEWMQAKFLQRLGGEFLEQKGEEWINDPDLDRDGFTNEFETSVSFTDPYVHNGRYAILAYSEDLSSPWKDLIRAVEEFLTSSFDRSDVNTRTLEGKSYGGFREDNIYKLYDRNMTFQNFMQVISDLVGRSDEDDMVLFLFAGHGEKNRICFSDRDVSYGEIEEELATLKARVQIFIVEACFSGSAVRYLRSVDRVVMTSCGETEMSRRGAVFHLFSNMQDESCDRDSNGYCSIRESFYGARKLIEDRFGIHPQLSGETLAETYLTELYLGEKKS